MPRRSSCWPARHAGSAAAPLQRGAPALALPARRRWLVQGGVQSQPGDDTDAVAHRGQQFECREAAVGDEDERAVGQPAFRLQDRLACPIGQRLVAFAVLLAPSRRWRENGQERQRPVPAGPADRRHHHQRQPAQPAGLDEVPLRGPDRVTIDAARLDLRSPPPLDGVVDADHHRPARQQPVQHVQQQPSRHRFQSPSVPDPAPHGSGGTAAPDPTP